MSKRATLAIVAILSSSASLCVASGFQPDNYTVYGVGNDSCGKYLAESGGKEIYLSWAQGYLSAKGEMGMMWKSSDLAAMKQWLNNYCKDNPLVSFMKAVNNLEGAIESK